MNLLNGLGKVKITFSFMVFFTALIWLLTPWLTNIFGIFGFPISHIVVSFFYLLVLFKAKNIFNLSIIKPISIPLISSLLMGVVLFSLDKTFSFSSWSVIIFEIITGAVIYFVLIRYVFQIKVYDEIKSIYEK